MVDIAQLDFYDAAPLEPHLLYQGEILIDVPLFQMPKPTRWLLLRTGKGGPILEALNNGQTPGTVKVWDSNKSEILWNEAGEGDYAMGYLLKTPVLVLSQTCDIQQKDYIQVAPIFPAVGDQPYVDRLQEGKIWSAFYIKEHAPEIAGISFADLEQIQAVHKTYIKRLKPGQHFRLAAHKVRELQRFITRYFGRPNSFDEESDTVPRDGIYLCIGCFYLKGESSAVSLKEGGAFIRCEKCGGRFWIIQGS